MLSAYSHLKLIDAVERVVNENAGQILSTDFVAQQLYGFLVGRGLIKAKEIVAKALWRGVEAIAVAASTGREGSLYPGYTVVRATAQNRLTAITALACHLKGCHSELGSSSV